MRINKNRWISYITGLFIMTIGVSFSIKSNLGVSPVSSVPYAATLTIGIEMGKATMIFHALLVLIQILLLRKNFRIKNLLQLVAGILFGYFTTFSNFYVGLLPETDNIILRLVMLAISIVLVAIGIFLYVPSDIIPLAGEGVIQAIAQLTKLSFSNVKILFDITLVTISSTVCLAVTHSFGSVGFGTIAAAGLVGFVHGRIYIRFGDKLKKILDIDDKNIE